MDLANESVHSDVKSLADRFGIDPSAFCSEDVQTHLEKCDGNFDLALSAARCQRHFGHRRRSNARRGHDELFEANPYSKHPDLVFHQSLCALLVIDTVCVLFSKYYQVEDGDLGKAWDEWVDWQSRVLKACPEE